jgi:uncharacterized membrane protein YczE
MDTTGMLKPVRWNTFIRDFVVIQFGFFLYGLAIALMLQANLGTSPWTIFSAAVAEIIGVTIGVMVILTGVMVLAVVLLMREPIGWGTLANILFIGPWVDVWMSMIPSVEQNQAVQLGMLLLSVLVMGFATAIYIGVNAGAGPRDSLMLGIHRKSGLSVRVSRAVIEITVSLVGWLLGGPLGAGTLLFALLIGPSVQWAFKLLRVDTKR